MIMSYLGDIVDYMCKNYLEVHNIFGMAQIWDGIMDKIYYPVKNIREMCAYV